MQVEQSLTLQATVLRLKLVPNMILAELNGEVIPRDAWGNRQFEHGDRLELVRVVAGG